MGAVLALWATDGVHPSHTDDVDGVTRLLDHDPEALLVAEVDGRLIGSVIAAWDGWRGSVYRLAVAPDQRRRGVAAQLLVAAEGRLAALGAARLQAIVVATDDRATAFWRSRSWEEQLERLRFVKG